MPMFVWKLDTQTVRPCVTMSGGETELVALVFCEELSEYYTTLVNTSDIARSESPIQQ